MDNINRVLVDSIKEAKWVSIEYNHEQDKKETLFWIYIEDVFPDGKMNVLIFNHAKSDEAKKVTISFKKILAAKLLDFTVYAPSIDLISKLENHPENYPWLQYECFDNNILAYLKECYLLDNDPYQDDYSMIDGIDRETLKKNEVVHLTPIQIDQIVKYIYHGNIEKNDFEYNELILTLLSIDERNKKYIVAYQTLAFCPADLTLKIVGDVKFNQSFLSGGKKHSLFQYTELTASEFAGLYKNNSREAIQFLNIGRRNNQILDTKPDITILKRNMNVDFNSFFEKIEQKHTDKTLGIPMRAFFGDITIKDRGRKIPEFVLYNKKIDADQINVIYHAMKDPVTYVQGPPGTGKTQTIFNIIISAYFNNRTTLVTSMNNTPVDGIIAKMHFAYRNEVIPFPFLRLGNNDFVKKATSLINKYSLTTFSGSPDQKKIKSIKDNTRQQFKKLTEALNTYQQRKLDQDSLDLLEKIKSVNDIDSPRITAAVNDLTDNLNKTPKITDEEIRSFFNPMSEDPKYLQYLYYSSIEHLNLLHTGEYAELREICAISVDEDRVSKFNRWCHNDENMKLLTNVFPLIFTTNISAGKLGKGDFLFSMLIMDEAGQCPIATSLLPIFRSESLVLVGDEDQLQPVIILPESTNQSLMKKYKINPNYDYCHNSIIKTMQSEDKVSEKIFLSHHYRCGKTIINFCNEYFYHNKLIVDDTTGPGTVSFFDCKNNAQTPLKNQSLEEATAVVNYIKNTQRENVVIVTPFINQASLINDVLRRENVKNVTASTIHKVQGAEADTVILSTALNPRTSDLTAKWLDSHKEIVNVAISRAKKNFLFFGDAESFKKELDKKSIWNQLVDYSSSKGTTQVIGPIQNNFVGKSNGSLTEKEFFITMNQIATIRKNIQVKNNISVKTVFPYDKEAQICEFEFDSVIYEQVHADNYRPIIGFEFDGGEHYTDSKAIQRDKRKEALCLRLNFRLIRLPNCYAKDYELLLLFIKKFTSGEKEIKDEQLQLF